MVKVGRPKGYVKYDINIILSMIDKLYGKTTLAITKDLKKIYPNIHNMTVLKYLKKLENLGKVNQFKVFGTKNKVRVWTLK